MILQTVVGSALCNVRNLDLTNVQVYGIFHVITKGLCMQNSHLQCLSHFRAHTDNHFHVIYCMAGVMDISMQCNITVPRLNVIESLGPMQDNQSA